MIVKKYKAPTETQAVMMAKEELGSGAVVLNVKSIKQRGIVKLFKKDVVEITAALEEKDFVQNVSDKKPTFSKSLEAVADEPIMPKELSMVPTTAIEEKLDSLHHLLKEQMKGNVENESEEEHIEEKDVNANIKFLKLIYNRLIESEVDEKYVNLILDEIESSIKKESTLDNIISAVYQKIILKLDEPKPLEIEDKKKIVFFMGPTGVGKTTTIAKLASKFKLSDKKKIAFITSDTYRIAAVEQLNTYAGILDIPVKVIYSPSELGQALEEFKKFELIFVDTAGRSHKDKIQREELKALFEAVDTKKYDIDKFLCLSMTTKYKDLLNITQAFSEIEDYRIIFTKLDETMCLGNVLNIKLHTGAPLSYMTIGQNVPDDIEVTNVQKLAKQLLGGNEI